MSAAESARIAAEHCACDLTVACPVHPVEIDALAVYWPDSTDILGQLRDAEARIARVQALMDTHATKDGRVPICQLRTALGGSIRHLPDATQYIEGGR